MEVFCLRHWTGDSANRGVNMNCCICHKGPQQGVALFRVNAKGQPGIWACKPHLSQTDAPPVDSAVAQFVDLVSRAAPPANEGDIK